VQKRDRGRVCRNLAVEEVRQRYVRDAVPLQLGDVALNLLGGGPEGNPALKAVDEGDGPGGKGPLERIGVADEGHDGVVPLVRIALHLVDLQSHRREVGVLGRRAVAPREVPLVEGRVQDREHQPRASLLEMLDADTLRRPHVFVVEEGARRAQHEHPNLVTAQAPTRPEKVLDPVAGLTHHHMHGVMAMKVRDHRRARV
jgi:hypothetical protein